LTGLHLRAGRKDEARWLSELALRSKGHWGYDQAFLDACRAELTLTPQDVEVQRVTVAERDALGFERITLEADPGAEPFYLAMGARRCGSVPSGSIPGRLIPLLEFSIAGVQRR
jgi:hypothetical protein